MAKLYKNVSGVITQIPNVYKNIGGVLTQIKEMWKNVGGVLTLIYSRAVVTLSTTSSFASTISDPTLLGFRIDSDGFVYSLIDGNWNVQNSPSNWIEPKGDAGAEYEVRFTNQQGTANFSSFPFPEDVWGATLDIDREYTVLAAKFASELGNATFEIRRVGTTTVIASGFFDWESTGS